MLGNAGVGAAGKEPLDNELGQDDWAKPGSTEVVLMSGGRILLEVEGIVGWRF